MNFSRRGGRHTETRRFTLHELVEEAIRLVKLTHQGSRVNCDNLCPRDLMLECDRQALFQVLVNILSNACDASAPGDQVELLAFEEAKRIRIEILDQGKGIEKEQLEYVFEPFYTTKSPGEGTGLGLAVAYKIIQDHNGSIQIDSQPGTGTRVVLELPKQAQFYHEPHPDH